MKVCAGVVLYNPDVDRLARNIDAIKSQVERIVFVDNASVDIDKFQEIFSGDNYIWIKNDANLGIAAALNQLTDFAGKNGYEWILTLDQDSICGDSFVQELLFVALNKTETKDKTPPADNKQIAMVGPLIIDRGIADTDAPDGKPLSDVEDVRLCITSGCLTNVKAVHAIGGFNEWLFIDEVDREMCLRLLQGGYRLVRVNTTRLRHEYGLKTVTRRILWKKVIYRNYTPVRVYYQTRNLVYMMRKYGREYTPHLLRRWVRLYFAFSVKLICEPNRINRLKAFVKGLKDGFSVNINKV